MADLIYSDIHEKVQNRFWARVRCVREGCWVWPGPEAASGYGSFGIIGGRNYMVHRLAYLLHYGIIEDGMFVLHTCDNKRCVRPSHLRLGTHAENMVDMSSRGRAARPDYVGSKHPRAKTNEADVLAIRAAYANGVTKTALASQYGLSFRAIVSIVHREKWTHI